MYVYLVVGNTGQAALVEVRLWSEFVVCVCVSLRITYMLFF